MNEFYFDLGGDEEDDALKEEVNAVFAGRVPPITIDIDPICAHHLACAIHLALTHPEHPAAPRKVLETISRGLEEKIAERAPRLAEYCRRSREAKGVVYHG